MLEEGDTYMTSTLEGYPRSTDRLRECDCGRHLSAAPQEGAVRPRPHADAALLAAARHVVIVQVHAVDALVVREHAP